jgi:hypothetical protein
MVVGVGTPMGDCWVPVDDGVLDDEDGGMLACEGWSVSPDAFSLTSGNSSMNSFLRASRSAVAALPSDD